MTQNMRKSTVRKIEAAVIGTAAAVTLSAIALKEFHNHGEYESIPAIVAKESPAKLKDDFYRTSPDNTGGIGHITDTLGKRWGLTPTQRDVWHAIGLEEAKIYGEVIKDAKGKNAIWTDWNEKQLGKVIGVGYEWETSVPDSAKAKILKRIHQAQELMAEPKTFKQRLEKFNTDQRTKTNQYQDRRVR